MTTPELLALSLGLSVVVAGMAYVGVRLFERGEADPVLRERAWAAALCLPVLPIVITAILMVGPRPIVEAPVGAQAPVTIEVIAAAPVRVPGIDTEQVARAALALAGLLGLARSVGLARRTLRLRRLVRDARPADTAVVEIVRAAARVAELRPPGVRLARTSGEALLAGLFTPVLILPEGLARDPSPGALRSVCAHELAHLKRGDHWALWGEEVLLTVLAINPILRLIRDRRAAAREEACDVQVLSHADGDVRRLYARSLIDALRAPAGGDVPALTFTSNRRIFVMRRLKAILSPAPVAGRRSRLTVLGLGFALAAVAGTSSVALAAKRQPIVLPASVVAAPTVPAAVTMPVASPEPVVAPVAVVEVAPDPAPEPVATPQAQVITNPGWSQHPRPLSYPAAALRQGLMNGRADLSCVANADGRVSACTIVSEDPAGAGFGAAALQAAAEARLSPRTVDSMVAGGTVRFSVRFTMAAE